MRLAPTQPLGHLNLGGAYMDEGRFAEARREFEEVLKLQESTGAHGESRHSRHVDRRSGARRRADGGGERARGRNRHARRCVRRRPRTSGRMKESARLTDELFQARARSESCPVRRRKALLGPRPQPGGRPAAATRRRLERGSHREDRAAAGDAADEMVAFAALIGDNKALAATYLDRAVKRAEGACAAGGRGEGRAGDARARSHLPNSRYDGSLRAGDRRMARTAGRSQRCSSPASPRSAAQHWDDAARHVRNAAAVRAAARISPVRAAVATSCSRAPTPAPAALPTRARRTKRRSGSGRTPTPTCRCCVEARAGISARSARNVRSLGFLCRRARCSAACSHELPQRWIEPTTQMEFVLLPAGEFVAGSPHDRVRASGRRGALSGARRDGRSTWPRARSRAAQWAAVMTPGRAAATALTAMLPVVNISWHDARQFLDRLNARAGVALPTAVRSGMGVRVPRRHDDAIFDRQRCSRRARRTTTASFRCRSVDAARIAAA